MTNGYILPKSFSNVVAFILPLSVFNMYKVLGNYLNGPDWMREAKVISSYFLAASLIRRETPQDGTDLPERRMRGYGEPGCPRPWETAILVSGGKCWGVSDLDQISEDGRRESSK